MNTWIQASIVVAARYGWMEELKVNSVYSKVSKVNVSLPYISIMLCCREILLESKESLVI
jgi:hypothetical protein